MLKTIIRSSLVLLAAIELSVTAQARIGYTLAECQAKYGPVVKSEAAWCGGTAYGFKSGGVYLYAIIGEDGRVNDISYFNNVRIAPLSPSVQESLWKQNQGDKVYDNLNPWLWNARREYKKGLGQEHGEHQVEYSWNGKEALVMNAAKNNGFQVRSLKGFYAEQKVIKSEMRGQVKVGAVTRVK
jgi:hypothetical protein